MRQKVAKGGRDRRDKFLQVEGRDDRVINFEQKPRALTRFLRALEVERVLDGDGNGVGYLTEQRGFMNTLAAAVNNGEAMGASLASRVYAPPPNAYSAAPRRGGYMGPEGAPVVGDYGAKRLRAPPPGYDWMQTPRGYALVSRQTHQVFDVVPY